VFGYAIGRPTATSTTCSGTSACIDLADPTNAALMTIAGAMLIDTVRDTIIVIRSRDRRHCVVRDLHARRSRCTASSFVQQHYDALKTGKPRAASLHELQAPDVPITNACEQCGSFEYEDVALSGKGTLMYASHGVAPPPHPRFAKFAPYVYGHIKATSSSPRASSRRR
jgi:hypothetical protein